ncbi:TetR/AcrR family transcriptional regulator [Streptomyces globisporus]|uniref:Transcriptional regulator, AcrR family n=1 Tax=Streptomyces globisporus TaxID=1908 RepID=A0ABM9H552_STRGL|nr:MULTISPECIES: TetR/AcrR family transcriptional regulator [Streptomyces]PPA40026.1 TetR family transcriptional regulator [Streptomyces griseus]RAN17389.1 TetR family transcriptional regulator [Streptomyces badius]AWL86211.1 TetR/AcrR family transcriptional regulator [Streptomyces globisporus]RAN25269.1 TetR family transcriptional regulator [Streptomyces badius]UIZ15308.1 TetR/AcrR family transcriptional regulator [Streptomyces sp. R527F]
MPTARQALLEAAHRALADRPWRAVRMVDVATLADVSRQTLYNEFGTKGGLAGALLRQAADGYLAGVDRALTAPAPDRPTAVALWTLRAARQDALVRALLTGHWAEGLPRPDRRPGSRGRTGGKPPPAPEELLALVRDRMAAASPGVTTGRCEIVLRLALSCVTVPVPDDDVTDSRALRLVREATRPVVLERVAGLSGPSRTAGGRSHR